ncbi:Os07g0532600 [Oryza sativa Japonica Group]|uniref:Os06g0492101 protein n=2 Tax=Oryza sativa subsp. japonica TaxID=39947 RepID=B9FTE0_ORYSJ|nr:hypothetical protein OsJ_21414 [Oryza sativa Japonica Group]KAB8102566.1 hypothetical protein EE612_034278 [Oryza sativa]KAB8105711.1 hypothetical protein EE612_039726 [Oryza sativa]KAF2923178.1 hypothetical protein DAI22_07g171000 [Oryza sativa Japonica Group]KAF2923180.1 hypothetical protein DAI22_07g171000 [Oryza sativa Japonica Group]
MSIVEVLNDAMVLHTVLRWHMSKGIEMLVQNGRFAFYMLKFPKYLHAGGRATAKVSKILKIVKDCYIML